MSEPVCPLHDYREGMSTYYAPFKIFSLARILYILRYGAGVCFRKHH